MGGRCPGFPGAVKGGGLTGEGKKRGGGGFWEVQPR